MMRPGGGKAKGAGFEREVCVAFSLWMSRGERDDLYWRSAMSGGRASVKFKQGKQNLTQTGDLTAIDPAGAPLTEKFLVECKFYRDLAMIGLYLDLQHGLNRHWAECVERAKQHKKWPLLVARQNRFPAFVCLDQNGINYLHLREKVLSVYYRQGICTLWLKDFLLHAHQPE